MARDEDLSNQIGKHLFFDLVDHDSVKSYRIQQEVPFKQFKVIIFVLSFLLLVPQHLIFPFDADAF